jgi:hypothetical protein
MAIWRGGWEKNKNKTFISPLLKSVFIRFSEQRMKKK